MSSSSILLGGNILLVLNVPTHKISTTLHPYLLFYLGVHLAPASLILLIWSNSLLPEFLIRPQNWSSKFLRLCTDPPTESLPSIFVYLSKRLITFWLVRKHFQLLPRILHTVKMLMSSGTKRFLMDILGLLSISSLTMSIFSSEVLNFYVAGTFLLCTFPVSLKLFTTLV